MDSPRDILKNKKFRQYEKNFSRIKQINIKFLD